MRTRARRNCEKTSQPATTTSATFTARRSGGATPSSSIGPRSRIARAADRRCPRGPRISSPARRDPAKLERAPTTGRRRPADACTAHDEAERHFEQLLRTDPNDFETVTSLATLRLNWAYVLANEGQADLALGDLGKNVTTLEHVLKQEPNDASARVALFRTYGTRAQILAGRIATPRPPPTGSALWPSAHRRNGITTAYSSRRRWLGPAITGGPSPSPKSPWLPYRSSPRGSISTTWPACAA